MNEKDILNRLNNPCKNCKNICKYPKKWLDNKFCSFECKEEYDSFSSKSKLVFFFKNSYSD